MSDERSTARLAELRKQKATLAAEAQRLESQVNLLEKQLEARDDESTQRRHDELAAKLEAVQDELQRVEDELEGSETARADHAASIAELEQLVDSLALVTKDLPELGDLLSAMRLSVGALATARRLERTHESLPEPREIAAALTDALLKMASHLSTRAQVKALAGRK
ncbi:MAG: hypothetical protein ACOZQL_38675 [Myxococcota bacterium]